MGRLVKETNETGAIIVRDRAKNLNEMVFGHPTDTFYSDWLKGFIDLAKIMDDMDWTEDVMITLDDIRAYSSLLKTLYRDNMRRFEKLFTILEMATDERIKFNYDFIKEEVMGVMLEPKPSADDITKIHQDICKAMLKLEPDDLGKLATMALTLKEEILEENKEQAAV